MNTKELIDRIFKEPGVKFELTEFENLGKATTAEQESKHLLEQARTRVEQLIEAAIQP